MTFQTTIKKRLEKVENAKMYSPDDAAKMGLILNIKFEPSRNRAYRLMKRGTIPTVNMGTEVQPRYFIQGSELRKFVEKQYLNGK